MLGARQRPNLDATVPLNVQLFPVPYTSPAGALLCLLASSGGSYHLL